MPSPRIPATQKKCDRRFSTFSALEERGHENNYDRENSHEAEMIKAVVHGTPYEHDLIGDVLEVGAEIRAPPS